MEPRFRTRFAALALVAATAGAAGCVQDTGQQPYGQTQAYQAPLPQQMDEPRALGLWKSSFGAVKIEEDLKTGQPGGGTLHGVWMYTRNGQDVIGYFAGQLKGNVLNFTWQEPSAAAPLAGEGYLVFDQAGQRFAGRWWTSSKDRVGEWSGWRQGMERPQARPNPYATTPYGQNPYGSSYGQPYGGSSGGYGGQGYGGYGDPNQPPPPPPSYPNSY